MLANAVYLVRITSARLNTRVTRGAKGDGLENEIAHTSTVFRHAGI